LLLPRAPCREREWSCPNRPQTDCASTQKHTQSQS
jgi:hypothetical protein